MRSVNKEISTPYREQVYEKLKNLIIFNAWEPGTVLSEVQLAKSFGTSRTPVREALRHLQSEGLLKVIPKKGILIPEIREKDVRDIFELREIIYCYAIRRAVENATPADIETLEKILADAEQCIERRNSKRLVSLSIRFHEFLLGLARNDRFLMVDKALRVQITRYISELLHGRQRVHTGWGGHKMIVAALKKRDKKLACRRMREHIRQGAELLLGKKGPLYQA